MIASGLVHKSRVWTFLFVSGNVPVVGGSVLRVGRRFPVRILAWLTAGVNPQCSWEDEDDLSYDPEELYNDGSSGLDDEENYGPYDEDEKPDEDEDEDFEYEEDLDEDDEEYDEDFDDYDEEEDFDDEYEDEENKF